MVIIDGKEGQIPAAAEEALRHLRHTEQPRVLWIDTVCINQRKLEDRSHQVALMHLVYKKALRVLAWLEQSNDSTPEMIRTLDLIHDHVNKETNNGLRLREVLYGPANIFQYSHSPLPERCDFDLMRQFFRRKWFHRLWVVQEAALSLDLCGAYTMPLLRMMRTAV